MADNLYPLALHQRFHDMRTHGDAANLFNISTRDGLTISNKREGFEQGARIFLWFFVPQPINPTGKVFTHLKPPTRCHFFKLKSAPGTILLYCFERFLHSFFGWRSVLLEKLNQTRNG